MTNNAAHREAMEQTDLALAARQQGDEALAIRLFRKAYELEAEVAAAYATRMDSEPTRSIKQMKTIKALSLLSLIAISGCSGYNSLTPPPQIKPPNIQIASNAIASMVNADGSPLTGAQVWQIGDYAVRTACHQYLNGAAAQQSTLLLGSTEVGMVGAGLSLVNPLAGVASSLVQTLIAAYSASGPVPTTADAILIENYLDTYEAGVTGPLTPALALSMIDDEWYHCSAGGIAVMTMQAKTTAQLGLIESTATSFSANARRVPSTAFVGRPIVTINAH